MMHTPRPAHPAQVIRMEGEHWGPWGVGQVVARQIAVVQHAHQIELPDQLGRR